MCGAVGGMRLEGGGEQLHARLAGRARKARQARKVSWRKGERLRGEVESSELGMWNVEL